MRITCLCNAGLAIEFNNQILFVDLPNQTVDPFVRLDDTLWERICALPDSSVCGFFFTHQHPDHYDASRLNFYTENHPGVLCCAPDTDGKVDIGPFHVKYHLIDHAPLPTIPPHVTAVISAGDKSVYVSGDANLDCEAHKKALNGKKTDAAFWNAMYLSRANTRELLTEAAEKNYIYHMPIKQNGDGMWSKLEKNFMRYPEELKTVRVISKYPTQVDI